MTATVPPETTHDPKTEPDIGPRPETEPENKQTALNDQNKEIPSTNFEPTFDGPCLNPNGLDKDCDGDIEMNEAKKLDSDKSDQSQTKQLDFATHQNNPAPQEEPPKPSDMTPTPNREPGRAYLSGMPALAVPMPFPLPTTGPQNAELDLLPRIPGLFRLLYLYTERGSNESFDKVLIDHDSMGEMMNTLSDGSYKSISKIDFDALDSVPIKPIGVYGSKSAIVQFLVDAHVIGDSIAEVLRRPVHRSGQLFPYLRSGIYIFLDFSSSESETSSLVTTYAVYWPQEETWNDDAGSAIQKNRVTFMRYLTKLASDIRLLVSEDHASSFVWKYNYDEVPRGMASDSEQEDSDDDDRFVKFEVTKAVDEEESVQCSPGFTFSHQDLRPQDPDQSKVSVKLVASETTQAFLVVRSKDGSEEQTNLELEMTASALRGQLPKYRNVHLGENVDEASIELLFDQGALPAPVSDIYHQYRIHHKAGAEAQEHIDAATSLVKSGWPTLKEHIEKLVRHRFATEYSHTLDDLAPETVSSSREHIIHKLDGSSKARNVYEQYEKQAVPAMIDSDEFKNLKERFIDAQQILETDPSISEKRKRDIINEIHSPIDSKKSSSSRGWWSKLGNVVEGATSLVLGKGQTTDRPKSSRSSFGRNDVDFLAIVERFNFQDYIPVVQTIQNAARKWLEQRITETTDELGRTIQKNLEVSARRRAEELHRTMKFAECRRQICVAWAPESSPSIYLELLSVKRTGHMTQQPKFEIKAIKHFRGSPSIEYSLTQLEVRAEDTRTLDEHPDYQPPFTANNVVWYTPTTMHLLYAHLLDRGRRLLQIYQSPGGIDMYLGDSRAPDKSNGVKHVASQEGRSYLFAVDERTCLLAVVVLEQGLSVLHTFSLKENFSSLEQRGVQNELATSRGGDPLQITALCFFSGTEEICLLDDTLKVRVYSLETRAFRPGIIELLSGPALMQSSPDGAALIVVERLADDGWQARLFHRATFGEKSDGITIPLPPEFKYTTDFTVSSLGQRSFTYLIVCSPSTQSLLSVSLRISRVEAEFRLREQKEKRSHSSSVVTAHNSILDCFAEVWERFPVIPAIPREFAARRSVMRLLVIEYPPRGALRDVAGYFRDMARDFIRRVPKPVGACLDDISVEVVASPATFIMPSPEFCKAGEWFVEAICLIPVHIAIAQDNHFVPLQDGRYHADFNNKLLGLDVAEIIDAITIGPYEAILSSYMSTKQVRVVSSMGEQSVGKSFSLNHLVDTSFAGSAMRTTEGVWLSICPTNDQVIVALDFEGSRSMERTAQEDMLLSLFNAAISNLVMFRNNFVFDRNAVKMFTSLQACTNLFDPKLNPGLFKGLLAIIIKDVGESDKKEIVEEFRSKFSQIVAKEQGDNFITALHDNQLVVIPWNVIESREFYARFSKLGKELLKRGPTHGNAGQFLLTLKTIMAKLAAQDWGALDQTLIKHRVAVIEVSLHSAIICGRAEVDAFGQSEGLKNYDTQEELSTNAGPEIFCLASDDASRRDSLTNLLSGFEKDPAKNSVQELQTYLQSVAERRLRHVKGWIDVNLSRFLPTENPDIQGLLRKFDELSRTLVSNLQLCSAKCGFCMLPCLGPKTHGGEHDCGTSHRCLGVCSYCDPAPHPSPKDIPLNNVCGLPAGHNGSHICEEAVHVCGKPCGLIDYGGCQRTCTKPIGHDDDVHLCAADRHRCRQSCELQNILLQSGETFSCNNSCTLSFDEAHDSHVCNEARSCPIRCELCRRYCTMGDHLHGLQPGAVHLCDQEHPCSETCQSPGVCRVEPEPESVEMVFNGLHDTFSYTKYTQIARRLNCAIPIPQGLRQHEGAHMHARGSNVTHICEAACAHCGYYCQLPYGHPQREHETAHGSMVHTVWALDAPDGSPLEVAGHRFGALDRGAPQLCSMNCRQLGRHAHLEYCRNASGRCQEAEIEHIQARVQPQPEVPKDWVSHRLFWARTGFKDPYPRADQDEFALCDYYCPGEEHLESSEDGSPKPSYCMLPIFHPPQLEWEELESGYVSNDGHLFECADPASNDPAFHVIFVLDCSTSMRNTDRLPLSDRPISFTISSRHNNRFGAVISAVHQFLEDRYTSNGGDQRRDSYSVIAFSDSTQIILQNDMTSSVNQIVEEMLSVSPSWGTNFSDALNTAQQVMEESWSPARSPVVIFLSDGEGNLEPDVMRGLCDRAVGLGSPLSFWSISFGPYSRKLQSMANIAKAVASRALVGTNTRPVPSDFVTAINTVQLARTFSNIATSLRKTRGSLINPSAPPSGPPRTVGNLITL